MTSKIKNELFNDWLSVAAPPPNLTVSEWADKYRILAGPNVSEPGRWKTSRAEYQRGIMDAVNDPKIETIVLMMSTQVGKTEILNNILGYFLSMDPCPIMVVLPTEDTAKEWSKDRLTPMLNSCPIFKNGSKKSSEIQVKNTIHQKKLNGGSLTVAFSSSSAQLASRPIRVLICDEVDRYQDDAGGEGDPVKLAVKRTTTFWNRKIILSSSPGNKGASRIDFAYKHSDQRRYYVPCPHCQTFQILKWMNVIWSNNQPETAVYQCEECRQNLDDRDIKESLKRGEWRANGKSRKVAGFHLNELYSPWKKLEQIVADFLECKNNPKTLKTFVNTSLAEVWKEKGIEIDEGPLMGRRETYEKVPMDGLVVVCGVDVQKNYIAGEIIAYGENYESWGLEYFEILGNTTTKGPWESLEEKLKTTYLHESGLKLKIACTAIDSGNLPGYIYDFCEGKEFKSIYPVKGINGAGGPVLGKKSWQENRVWLFPVGTDTAKHMIYSWLQLQEIGPGYMHFPSSYTEEYFKQLTAEELRTRYVRGFEKTEWVKKRRNEALDCRVYSLAALHIFNPDYEAIKQIMNKAVQGQETGLSKPIKTIGNSFVRQSIAFRNFMNRY